MTSAMTVGSPSGTNTNVSAQHVRPQGPQDSGYIASLDGWRAIAVSLVIASHCQGMLINNGSRPAMLLANFVSHAGYGVDIFFALSGYLITTLLLREKENFGNVDLATFYTRRFFRILPPVIVYLVVLAALIIAEFIPRVGAIEFIASTLFFRNYISGSWYTGHFWSLSIEEHFYAVVPVLVLLLRPRALAATCVVLAVACFGIRGYEFAHTADFGPLPQFRTENRVDALLWGSILAQICRSELWRDRLRSLLKPAVVIAVAVVTAALLVVFDAQEFRRTLTAIILPLLIVSTVLRPNDFSSRILELAPLRYVGRISYSLYIWQMMFLGMSPRSLGPLQDFPLALVMPFVLAYLSYRFVEKPCVRLGHRIRANRRRSPQVEFAN